jgi:galactokinase
VPRIRQARGPGRVNLIGDHTDYNLGVALPMAIGLGADISYAPDERPVIVVESSAFDQTVELSLDLPGPGADLGDELAGPKPAWTGLVAAMISLCRPPSGGRLRIDSTVPVGSGLSSSAAVTVALAEVLSPGGSAIEVARLCQRAEHLVGVPVGLMDPLVCAGGQAGHAMLIDFDSLAVTTQVAIPAAMEIIVVDSGQPRTLADSGYATRVTECRSASRIVGPLGLASADDLSSVRDPLLRRRARHVISECRRTREFADALASGRGADAGALMVESHRSLADDFEVSTEVIDGLIEILLRRPGVLGARLTGAGFGGSVVVLARPGALGPSDLPGRAWRVEAADGTVAARREGSHPERPS